MIVLSDSTPLISLAKIEQFFLLERLFGRVILTPEVYSEVVVSGAGLPGAADVSQASWVEVRPIKNPASLPQAQSQFSLDIGELSTLVLAKEINADLLLLDDLTARKIAMRKGFRVQGTIGILEAGYRQGLLADLRQAYTKLLSEGVYLDRAFINSRLSLLELGSL